MKRYFSLSQEISKAYDLKNLIILLVEKVTVIVDQIIRESYCETIILCSKISNVVYGT